MLPPDFFANCLQAATMSSRGQYFSGPTTVVSTPSLVAHWMSEWQTLLPSPM
jgi:hypothetical protein